MISTVPTQRPLALNEAAIDRASWRSDRLVKGTIALAQRLVDDPQRAVRLEQCACLPCHYTARVAGQAFTGYTCAGCQQPSEHPNTAVPLLCRPCAQARGLCRGCGARLQADGPAGSSAG